MKTEKGRIQNCVCAVRGRQPLSLPPCSWWLGFHPYVTPLLEYGLV